MIDYCEVRCECPWCHTINFVNVKKTDYEKYQGGEGLIQNIFSYLSAQDREHIKTGICQKCWSKML